jgi:hypothetical protein
VIKPSDVALLAAMWRALEQHAGDEAEAAWAVWERMKAEPALREAFFEHIEIDASLSYGSTAKRRLKTAPAMRQLPAAHSASGSTDGRTPPPLKESSRMITPSLSVCLATS